MGTDIHMRVEIRRDKNSSWVAVPAIFKSDYYDPIRDLTDPDKGDSIFNTPFTPNPYSERNYTVFAVLSNVRNGVGFAGVTGDPIEPQIAADRGLPEDLAHHLADNIYEENEEEPHYHKKDDETNQEFAERAWIFGEHSFGYASLKELLDYDWDKLIVNRGKIDATEFFRCYKTGKPPRYSSRSVSGRKIENITEEEAIRRIMNGTFPVTKVSNEKPEMFSKHELYVAYKWTNPLRQNVEGFLEAIDPLRKWGNDYNLWHSIGGYENPKSTQHDSECIRLVFGYDS